MKTLFWILLLLSCACFITAECITGTLRKTAGIPLSQLHRAKLNLRGQSWHAKMLRNMGLLLSLIGWIVYFKAP